ncbi:MAG: DEAD/DEAH box helicase family protein [Planctomycetota bacterium]|nr:DEAD/DEAH box helicase family protein [Planctomycetota bacterium]
MSIQHVNAISNRLSLRPPQKSSLEILARLCEIVDFQKSTDAAAALDTIRSEYSHVEDFEREFPSLCFALATGVGKTRLMGAFISYLHRAEHIDNFFVLAPNLTIYNKLIADFTPGTPKYVFQGIAEFATTPPEIVTGDNYESGRGVRSGRLFTDQVNINIFNIAKITAEVRGGAAPRIKRLSEYIGESYFDYLSKLDDLVLLMDESHRYRASAGVKAINELKPILGLELTATPQIMSGQRATPFKNVIFSYPLSSALDDGFVKSPCVATRENFNVNNYDEAGLERLKLEDGIHIHEETKVQLEVFARERGVHRVKPFMLVVAQDTEHASRLKSIVEGDDFFTGQYRGKVAEVHSNQRGEEKDENVQKLLAIENSEDPTEIVIHVDQLKEGWDVTNLYTIVPLRAFNSRTLIEQAIGRGLRLPYGKRVGVDAVDRLTIVAHDKFQDIIDEANRGDSILKVGLVVIGRDIPEKPSKAYEVKTTLEERLFGPTPPADGEKPLSTAVQKPLFDTDGERRAAKATLDALPAFEKLRRAGDLRSPEVQQKLVEQVKEVLKPVQGELPTMAQEVDVKAVVAKTVEQFIEMTIEIPRIVVLPSADATYGFHDFDLDCRNVRLQPVSQDILIQNLQSSERYKLQDSGRVASEQKLEDYLVRGLIDFDDISYDDHAEQLYKLAGQLITHLRSYLANEEEVINVVISHTRQLVDLIHAQLQEHYFETATSSEVKVTKGFRTLRSANFLADADEMARPFRQPVEERRFIRGMVFGGFAKCLYPKQKFDSDPERRFSVILENDGEVRKWLKPGKGVFNISYRSGVDEGEYEPDFVVETKTGKYLCEPKKKDAMEDPVVIAKAEAASAWCHNATEAMGTPWKYLLIPHDMIDESKTLAGLVGAYEYQPMQRKDGA